MGRSNLRFQRSSASGSCSPIALQVGQALAFLSSTPIQDCLWVISLFLISSVCHQGWGTAARSTARTKFALRKSTYVLRSHVIQRKHRQAVKLLSRPLAITSALAKHPNQSSDAFSDYPSHRLRFWRPAGVEPDQMTRSLLRSGSGVADRSVHRPHRRIQAIRRASVST
jgi:hypothetical protein